MISIMPHILERRRELQTWQWNNSPAQLEDFAGLQNKEHSCWDGDDRVRKIFVPSFFSICYMIIVLHCIKSTSLCSIWTEVNLALCDIAPQCLTEVDNTQSNRKPYSQVFMKATVVSTSCEINGNKTEFSDGWVLIIYVAYLPNSHRKCRPSFYVTFFFSDIYNLSCETVVLGKFITTHMEQSSF